MLPRRFSIAQSENVTMPELLELLRASIVTDSTKTTPSGAATVEDPLRMALMSRLLAMHLIKTRSVLNNEMNELISTDALVSLDRRPLFVCDLRTALLCLAAIPHGIDRNSSLIHLLDLQHFRVGRMPRELLIDPFSLSETRRVGSPHGRRALQLVASRP